MNRSIVFALIVIASGILFFIPFLGNVHLFDWDEINFAESAREMIVTGDYSRVQINYMPFWEKPPLFFWLQAVSMNIFGINEFAARFPNAITGIITLITFFLIGKKLNGEQFGFIWALSYLGSFLPHLYFKSGIIDPVFNYFIFISIYFLFECFQETANKKSLIYALLSGTSVGLAVLTKGPVALLIIFICIVVYWIISKFSKLTSLRNIFVFTAAIIIVSMLWFGMEVINNGVWFIREFVDYQVNLFRTPVAGHQGPVYYHFLVVFLGCFPMSVMAIPFLFRFTDKSNGAAFTFNKFMLILFWSVLVLFTIVKTKIIHYSSLSYFPLSFIAAVYLHEAIQKRMFGRYLIILLVITGTIFSFILFAVPLVFNNKEIVLPYITDPFAAACLNTYVNWSNLDYLAGLIYYISLIVAVIIISRKRIFAGVMILFYATAFCLFFYLASVVPKIEKYTQAPAVNFYESLKGKDVYVRPVGFKSYAHFYYFGKMPRVVNEPDENRLLYGKIDKPAYFVAKVTKRDFFDKIPECKLIGQEGGFLFYVRMPDPGY